METISRTVETLQPNLREAMEAVVGHPLEAGQRLVIQILDSHTPPKANGGQSAGSRLPDWCNVLTDLTADEAAALDRSISARTESRTQP